MNYKIPFNKPFIAGNELNYIAQAIQNGHASGDGPFTKKCEKFIEETFGAGKVLLTTSCTAALEMAAILCDISEGDEVVMPSYTFVSTANAFLLRGAKPVFVDIRSDTMNMDERFLEDSVTEKTKAIVPVHYAGIAVEMDRILSVARNYGIKVIEDAAQGVNASYDGKFLGTLGDFGAFSFHETKNISCGEGGALLINNPEMVDRAEIIREKGTNRSQFFREQVDKYTWVDIGSSYVPSDLLAAFLLGQLDHLAEITEKRKQIYNLYFEMLNPLAQKGLLQLPTITEKCGANYHMFFIVVKDLTTRIELIEDLKQKGILSVFHYIPLHLSPVGKSLGYSANDFPVTEDISDRLLRLPFYNELRKGDVEKIVTFINEFFSKR